MGNLTKMQTSKLRYRLYAETGEKAKRRTRHI